MVARIPVGARGGIVDEQHPADDAAVLFQVRLFAFGTMAGTGPGPAAFEPEPVTS